MISELKSVLFSDLIFILQNLNCRHLYQLSLSKFLQLQQLSFMAVHQSLTKSEQNLAGKPQENIRKPTTGVFAVKVLESAILDRHVGGNIYRQVGKRCCHWDSNLQTTHSLHQIAAFYC